MAYRRDDNGFPWISHLPRAQKRMEPQLRTPWPKRLYSIGRRLNPDHETIFPEAILEYYGSVYPREGASDLLFRTPQSLAEIDRALIRHGITAFSSQDGMRFLGQKPHPNLEKEVRTSYKERKEGARIKHWVGRNSVKLYDQAGGEVLRAEATLQDPRPYLVYRAKEGDPQGPKEWRRMRAGIADLARRADVSQGINDRYLEAMAAADTSTPIGTLAGKITPPVWQRKKRARGLRPWDPEDLKLFRAANDGKWCLQGFRNRDLQEALFGEPAASADERRRRSGRVTRLIRLLRAHGVIRKLPRVRRYRVTPRGQEILTASLVAQDVTLEQLRNLAA
jgi:hypothetical protein